MQLYVSPCGDDKNTGTVDSPLSSIQKAISLLRGDSLEDKRIIFLRAGTHFLNETVVMSAADCKVPLTIKAFEDESVTISGGTRVDCDWRPYQDGIYVSDLPEAKNGGLAFTQMFADGNRQIRARFPNRDHSESHKRDGYANPAEVIRTSERDPNPDRDSDMVYDCEPYKGIVFDADTFSQKRWANPSEAVIHIFHSAYWGNMQWHLKDVNYDTHEIWFGDGGHQMGAKWTTEGSDIGKRSRYYVENVFEELDAPMEWYLDTDAGKLYWMPEDGVDPNDAIIEVPQLQTLFDLRGTQLESIENVAFEKIHFSMTEITHFEHYEVPSLGDWALYRGGAVRLEGTRNCTIKDCLFAGLGGNSVFANRFNRDLLVTGCTFHDIGDSGVLLVGELESTTGTQKQFPFECRVVNNHFYDLGIYGKQTAGVYVSRAKRITIGHNLMHDLPRAGICFGDGTWGGHLVEYNHIHDSCLETTDHGPFNAWGRDRYWSAIHGQSEMLKNRCIDHGDAKSDAMETVIMRHNFFVEKEGWGLDLDDGASNYDIYNNVCVGVGMKLREGSWRTIHNNIWVNCACSPCFHVGNEDNHDRYYNNITVMSPEYQAKTHDRLFKIKANGNEIYYLVFPPVRTPWLEHIDNNCFFNDLGEFTARVLEREGKDRRELSLDDWQAMGFDKNSVFGDPMFVDPDNDDYRVKPDSPALTVGFKNFEMGNWGLTDDFPTCWD